MVFISAGTGHMTHMAVGATDMTPTQLDGDGIEDLILFRRTHLYDWHSGARLQATPPDIG